MNVYIARGTRYQGVDYASGTYVLDDALGQSMVDAGFAQKTIPDNAAGVLGTSTFTVGARGDFSSIDKALAHIAAQTGMTQVPGTTGTVSVVNNADSCVGTGTNFESLYQAGDYIDISGDVAGIMYPIWGKVTNTSLLLGTGYTAATNGSRTYTMWRPNRFVLQLLPGIHTITAAVALPAGIDLSIIGGAASSTILVSTVSTDYAIKYPRVCRLSIENITLMRESSYAVIGKGFSALQAGFGVFRLAGIKVLDQKSVGGQANVAHLGGSSIQLENIYAQSYGGVIGCECDEFILDNFRAIVWEGSADVLTVGPYDIYNNTKPIHISGLQFDRMKAATLGAGGMLELSGTTAGTAREVNLRRSKFNDFDSGATTNPSCIYVSLEGANFKFEDVEINVTGSGKGIFTDMATGSIEFVNVRAAGGAPVKFQNDSGVTMINRRPGSAETLTPAANAITPNANISTVKNVTFSANLTVNNPIHPQDGQELVINYFASAASLTITYGNAFKSSSVPASTLNGNASHRFVYRASTSQWVQSGGALVWV